MLELDAAEGPVVLYIPDDTVDRVDDHGLLSLCLLYFSLVEVIDFLEPVVEEVEEAGAATSCQPPR